MKNKKNIKKITKNTTLAEILDFPGTSEILIKYNVPCLSCPLARFELSMLRLSDICNKYSINIEELLKELNKNIKSHD